MLVETKQKKNTELKKGKTKKWELSRGCRDQVSLGPRLKIPGTALALAQLF